MVTPVCRVRPQRLRGPRSLVAEPGVRSVTPRPLSRPRPARMLWITAVWGDCFVAIRWGLRDAPVLWFATLRSVVAGLVLLALGVAQRPPPPVGTRTWSLITKGGRRSGKACV